MTQVSFDLKPADPANFSGEAHMALLAMGSADAATHVYYVRFGPGARTHWHTHSGVQMLLVQEGRCLLQVEDGPVEAYEAGVAIRIAAGQRHWHGADSSAIMVHVAINIENERTEWHEAATSR